ncbi:hypothetical protein ACIP5Y_21250 [Nocardia sp. NPDC088792]|uniref:hypothetical protein n=1 Tax=Nocardia sp. NPDC088792 TaxID=3364332 RepID=UPI00380995E1
MREPFPSNQINLLPKPYKKDSAKGRCNECGGYHGLPAVHLEYVGHAALTDRLLDADPEWYWEPVALDAKGLPQFDENGGLWIRLTVSGVTRLGYGDSQGKRGGDAVKEAIGDALRNAGMRFGAALDLWHKGDLHDANERRGTKPQAADDARRELLGLLTEQGIAPADAVDRFAADGNGHLGTSADVEAIRALTAYYRQQPGGEA